MMTTPQALRRNYVNLTIALMAATTQSAGCGFDSEGLAGGSNILGCIDLVPSELRVENLSMTSGPAGVINANQPIVMRWNVCWIDPNAEFETQVFSDEFINHVDLFRVENGERVDEVATTGVFSPPIGTDECRDEEHLLDFTLEPGEYELVVFVNIHLEGTQLVFECASSQYFLNNRLVTQFTVLDGPSDDIALPSDDSPGARGNNDDGSSDPPDDETPTPTDQTPIDFTGHTATNFNDAFVDLGITKRQARHNRLKK